MTSHRHGVSSPPSRSGQFLPNLSRRQLLLGLSATSLISASPSIGRGSIAINRLNHFKRGFNLPGVADTSFDKSRLPSADVFAQLKGFGFEAVRLPIDPGQLLQNATDRAAFLRGLEKTVGMILASGLRLMLDMHPNGAISDILKNDHLLGGGMIESAWNELLMIADFCPPDLVMMEVLNEPQLPAAVWPVLRQRLVDLIRRKLNQHTLIWCAANYQTIEETVSDSGPDDDNAIAAVHFYYPMIFTHQGRNWTDDALSKITDYPFPSTKGMPGINQLRLRMQREGRADAVEMIDRETSVTWDPARIDEEFSKLKDWSRKTAWPVIINEFGVLRWSAPKADRALWLHTVRTAAENNGFGWTHWDMDQAFGFMTDRRDRNSFDGPIIQALTGGDE